MARKSNSLGSLIYLIIASPFIFLLSLCSKPDTPPEIKKFTPYLFEGVAIPGTKENAKNSEFTECAPDGDKYKCARKTTLLIHEFPVQDAFVTLDDNDNFNINSPYKNEKSNELTYRNVNFRLPHTEYNTKCVEKYRSNQVASDIYSYPIECRKSNDGVDYFKYVLLKNGWVEQYKRGGRGSFYIKKDVPITINIEFSRYGTTEGSIDPTVIESVNYIIAKKVEEEKRKQEKESKDKDVIESMKN